MDTLAAYYIAKRAKEQGKSLMVFDWVKAATIIRDRGASEASAGLESDWEYS